MYSCPFHEQVWLQNCPSSFKSVLYRRYVDNCFLLYRSLNHVPPFLKYLNQRHPNIAFNSEDERDGKLPFLDIDIPRSQGKFSTSVYRKPTFTGLFTNFHSFILLTYKRCLVSCLIHRIFNLCSSYENFHIQLEVVRNLFKLNGFPSHMFERITRRFLDNTFDPKPSVQTVPKTVPISAFHSQEYILSKSPPKSIAFVMPLSLISILDLFSAPPDESLLFSLLRIKFPST